MLKPPTVTSCCVKTCLHNFRNWLGESAGLFFWILYLHHMQVSIAIKHVYVFSHTVHAITGLRLSFLSILIMHFGFLGACTHAHKLSHKRLHTFIRTLAYSCQLSLTHIHGTYLYKKAGFLLVSSLQNANPKNQYHIKGIPPTKILRNRFLRA